MATRALLATVVQILALPLVVLSHFLVRSKPHDVKRDLQQCLYVIDAAPNLPSRFVATLVAAEDHRSAFHPGVDPIAILRVIWVWVRTRKIQGASTIEQQLVRVVLGRYERTLRRKFKEQMLAIALAFHRPKARIASAYLCIAFYGSGQYGISALKRVCGRDLSKAPQDSVSRVIARLKYPEPLLPAREWQQKICRRAQYITGRLSKSVNQSVQLTKATEVL